MAPDGIARWLPQIRALALRDADDAVRLAAVLALGRALPAAAAREALEAVCDPATMTNWFAILHACFGALSVVFWGDLGRISSTSLSSVRASSCGPPRLQVAKGAEAGAPEAAALGLLAQATGSAVREWGPNRTALQESWRSTVRTEYSSMGRVALCSI